MGHVGDEAGTAAVAGTPIHGRWVRGVFLVLVMLGALIMIVHFTTHIDVTLFLADPAEKAALPFYTGVYTYIGALVLFAACAVCLFSSSLLRTGSGTVPGISFLLSLGLLAAWLGADDLLLFHEWAGLAIAELRGEDDVTGARSKLEGVVFAGYGAAWLAWIAVFRKAVLRTSFGLLLLALAGLAASVMVDVGMFLFPGLLPGTEWMPTTVAVAEEMLKLAGIFFLLAYAVDTSRVALLRLPISAPEASPQGR